MSSQKLIWNPFSRRSFLVAISGSAVCLPLASGLQSEVPDAGIPGTINTVIGGGPVGNKPATECAISTPFALSLDGAGNLYVTDNYYHRVYRVSAASGILTTVAGSGIPGFSGDDGPAINARLNFPYGLDVDESGNIGIGDANNNRIRYVDGASGLISTVAGTGKSGYNGDNIPASAALLAGPHGVALGNGGADLYRGLE